MFVWKDENKQKRGREWPIDNANNLVFWCRFLNKLEPWYAVYIMQQ